MYWNLFGTLFLHTLITFLVAWLLVQEFVCIDDCDYNVTKCRPKCNYGKFSLFGMAFCYSWLSCSEIDRIQLVEEISHGAVKRVQYCRYRGLRARKRYLARSWRAAQTEKIEKQSLQHAVKSACRATETINYS